MRKVVGTCRSCGAEAEAIPTTPLLPEGELHEPDHFSLAEHCSPKTELRCMADFGGYLNIPTSVRLADN